MITATTPPISMACARRPSPGSAKKSMYTTTTAVMKKRTNQSWVGITPTAPWTRSSRASSRCEVWPSHWS